MADGSADSPRTRRVARIAGVDVTISKNGFGTCLCPNHSQKTVTIAPKINKYAVFCPEHCPEEDLPPALLAGIRIELSNGGDGKEPAPKPATNGKRNHGQPSVDSWKLALYDPAHHECETLLKAGGGIAGMLTTEPLESFIATINQHRNIANDPLTHDPELTPIESDEEIQMIARALQEA